MVRTVSEKQVSIDVLLTLGTLFEMPKKLMLEPWWEDLGKEEEKKGEAAHVPARKIATRPKGH